MRGIFQFKVNSAAMRTVRSVVVTVCLLFGTVVAVAQVRLAPATDRNPDQGKVTDGDPFEIATGIYYREYEDLYINDTIPINFVRTQRNKDPRSRAFGIGASTSYDMFIIGDVAKFSWVALVFADGSQATYSRISAGTSYLDGIFEDKSDPSEFLGSRIWWNKRGGWTVRLRDGREYTVQGCNAKSKPGQCAVTEVKNAQGEALVIRRDGDGNMLRITSPHGHFIEFRNDSSGRILQARDDAGERVDYTYDGNGCLIESHNWRGDEQKFSYDSHFNMVFVHERGPHGRDGKGRYDFKINNRYDAQDRLAAQLVSNGDTYSAKYHADAQGRVRQTDVRARDSLTKYFFDESGYWYREEFQGDKRSRWILEYVREPNAHELRDVVLTCPTGKMHLPVSLGRTLGSMGGEHKRYMSRVCSTALPSRPGTKPPQKERAATAGRSSP